MKGRDLPLWVGTAALAAVTTVAFVTGRVSIGAMAFGLAGLLAAYTIGRSMAIDLDGEWLPLFVTLAYLARLVGAGVHYYVVTVLYRTGDSLVYHDVGVRLAEEWRSLAVPAAPGGSAGTRFVELATGLFYVPGEPSLLVGYLVYASLGFLGTVALYAAFRNAFPTARLRLYAFLLFFLPSMLFWPGTIGKEALMLAGIGAASLGAVRLFARRGVGSVVLCGAGVGLMAAVRPHVAAMLVAALMVALVFSGRQESALRPGARIVIASLTVLVLLALVSMATTRLGVTPSEEGIDDFLVQQEERTSTGGSEVTGTPVRNPVDLPEATLRVLFRPLPHEAHNAQAALSALESAVLLGLLVWRLPAMVRNRRRLWRPYMLYSLVFVGAFVVAFSSILNLGILARQRVQVLPFLLVLIVALGWDHVRPPVEDTSPTVSEPVHG